MTAIRKKSWLRYVLRAPVYLYRWRLGWMLGNRFLLLTHIGRRTGLPHQTVLEVMEYRKQGPEAVVMSGFGRAADWLRNISAESEAITAATSGPKVEIGSQHFIASYRFLGEEEAMAVVQGYERRNWWMAPMMRCILSRLLGWRYRGSEDEQRRLVGQLPLLAFRPRA